MVAWIIIWGTHVRNRPVGVKSEFCGDCLRVSRFTVTTIETVGHLYYIPLGRYSLHSVTGECHTCGALVALDVSHCDSVVPKQEAAEQSIAELIEATNPELLPALNAGGIVSAAPGGIVGSCENSCGSASPMPHIPGSDAGGINLPHPGSWQLWQ